MIRAVLYLFLVIILITVLRSVIGVLSKFFQGLLEPPSSAASGEPRPAGKDLGGELKRDPICGTYISTATSLKKTIKGDVVHFCSPECRDKFPA